MGVAMLCASPALAQETLVSGLPPTDEGEAEQLTGFAKRVRGSALIFEQSTTPDSLFPGSQLSAIPSYQWWFSFRPRYYFLDNLSLRARFDLTLEWLNAVDTTLLREPTFGDVWTDLAYNPPKVWGIESTVALRGIWGASIA